MKYCLTASNVNNLITRKITVTGMVQGIGYRPFVAKLASKMGITGNVRNSGGIVSIIATGSCLELDAFSCELKKNAPKGANVMLVHEENTAFQDFGSFCICESEEEDKSGRFLTKNLLIPTDLPICEDCTNDLLQQGNRRYRYPFISCASCGPRYSIIERLPYDRHTTVMKEFKMCDACAEEYSGAYDIRRHAQTISCHSCGPQPVHISIENGKLSDPFMKEDALLRTADIIKEGGIAAIKDIGGYHLVCSPFLTTAVSALRLIKGREKKPFAVMFSDISSVHEYGEVDKKEEELLLSTARPIVLIRRKQREENNFVHSVCSDSPDIGAMLPCNALQILLVKECGPLIMTSANRSGEPIIIDNETMSKWMTDASQILLEENCTAVSDNSHPVPLCLLMHERKILTPLDDSVMRIVNEKPQMFRRARGFVPQPIFLSTLSALPESSCSEKEVTEKQIFAAGGDLKSCFCYLNQNRAYLSQYFGDIQDADISQVYERELLRMQKLFGFKPQLFVSDLHPGYQTGNKVKALSHLNNGTLIQIQHHHAHIASVIAEHGLAGTTLGVAFDGTGYGTDASIWGSEFLLCQEKQMSRIGSLLPVPLIGSDEGAKNADTILYGYLSSFYDERLLDSIFLSCPFLARDKMEVISKAISHNINTVTSTSMGRLFDAVSALLNICHYNSYEGEAAILLEYAATKSFSPYPLEIEIRTLGNELNDNTDGRLTGDINGRLVGDTKKLFSDMAEGITKDIPIADLAAGFIHAVGDFTVNMCRLITASNVNVGQIAISGGTFQNKILTQYVTKTLKTYGFMVYRNEQVPCNDGGICLGQAYLCRFPYDGTTDSNNTME